jgi:outer membrane protein OmpA-like peptidoglycan-associated protein
MSRESGQRRRRAREQDGAFWAPLTYLLAGVLCVMVFVAALPREPVVDETADQRHADVQARIGAQGDFPTRWREALDALCADPILQAEGIAADCETGTITFGDDLFDEADTVQLTEEGIRKLHHAISSMLRNLRTHEAVWSRLDAIELRGHADPRAMRDPYVTNMRVSQQRPMAIMFYLISDWGLSELDRRDLESLLILSAASHSRPPEACPEETYQCYPYWRRVEITPRLRGAELANEAGRFSDDLRRLVDDAS